MRQRGSFVLFMLGAPLAVAVAALHGCATDARGSDGPDDTETNTGTDADDAGISERDVTGVIIRFRDGSAAAVTFPDSNVPEPSDWERDLNDVIDVRFYTGADADNARASEEDAAGSIN